MYFYWLGQSCLKIQVKSQDKNLTILTDPFDATAGLKLSRLQADLVLYTNDLDDPKHLVNIGGQPFVIDDPGEYDVKGIFVQGIESAHQGGNSLLYLLQAENIYVAILGNLDHQLTAQELEVLEGADVVCLPVGGGDALGSSQAAAVVNQLEPRLIIPLRFGVKGIAKKYEGVEKFCQTMGVKREQADKLKVTTKELPSDETKVVVLTI